MRQWLAPEEVLRSPLEYDSKFSENNNSCEKTDNEQVNKKNIVKRKAREGVKILFIRL